MDELNCSRSSGVPKATQPGDSLGLPSVTPVSRDKSSPLVTAASQQDLPPQYPGYFFPCM